MGRRVASGHRLSWAHAGVIFGLSTLLVYFVLAARYESWRLPLGVILVVPMCFDGKGGT